MSKTFEENFKEILEPVLIELDFEQIKLQGCMCPEYLFTNESIWFSLSWDWRDRYLDVSLGKLYWFKDVMERIVVIGDYSSYERRITTSAMDCLENENEVFTIIASTLKNALQTYNEKYDDIYENYRVSRGRRSGINIDEYIGNEVKLSELHKFKA